MLPPGNLMEMPHIESLIPLPIEPQQPRHLRRRHPPHRPPRPQQNGKVERSHRIDHEEFRSPHQLPGLHETVEPVRAWERHDNYKRFSLASASQTPAQKLAIGVTRRGLQPNTECPLIPGSAASEQRRLICEVSPARHEAKVAVVVGVQSRLRHTRLNVERTRTDCQQGSGAHSRPAVIGSALPPSTSLTM